MDDISSHNVSLSVSDGSSMDAFVARPTQDGKHPGVILFQEAFGVNAHIRDVAGRFAREGYVTIAPELYHRTAKGFDAPYDDFSVAMPHLKAMTPDGIKQDARAAFDWLNSQSFVKHNEIASVGFCMGGRASFLACASLPLLAAVSFYGGGITPALLGEIPNLHATMLFFWGGLDKHIGKEQIRPIIEGCEASGRAFVNVEISGADHAFFNDVRPSYNAEAADLAWKLTLMFLEQNLKIRDKCSRVR